MTATVRITETNIGYLTFDTIEEAQEWADDPDDFDGVKWRSTEADFRVIDPARPQTDADLDSSELSLKYGHWSDHPLFPARDWQAEVEGGQARLGYWDWVVSKLEQQAEDADEADA